MKYPKFVEIEDKKYKINTDFRVAIECNKVAEDETIGDYERSLAVIYLLFGDEGIDTPQHYKKLLELAKKYLSCGKELKDNINEKPDMDYIQDMDFIEASFMSDYHMDLSEENMHWWKFFNLLNGLSNSELGNSCVLNRIRNLRNMNPNDIKDKKERDKLIKLQEQFALKKNQKKKKPTEKEKQSASEFLRMLKNRKE